MLINHPMKKKLLDLDFIISKIKRTPSIQVLNSKKKIEFEKFLKKYYFNNFSKIKIFNKKINLNYIKFGNTDIFDTLLISEFVVFDFYYRNKKNYKNVLDIGSNIGIHSIILSKLGFNVSAYEPDYKHYLILKNNIRKNNCKNIKTYNYAIWSKKKILNFNKVIGNTTGSHIVNSKSKVYGEIKKVKVKSVSLNSIIENFDLIKIDCEGSEKEIFKNINLDKLENVDCILEITDKLSREIIWQKLKNSNLKIYSQKNNWKRCKTISSLPKNWKEGNVFISKKNTFY